ncbi:hypothetical protein [Maribacter sp. HTCC2170]|uniref:hypothetical protein n=1 Tax=Maribacter sp. (strain HTCC2170 / KCCM 42371) TaxID=313603 RepID=UPI00006B6E98|nr:hypothetical protein [Maribacter sp. HTCC2170]EAQ99659.1 hypothetical protein FB2170_01826 [Maribacter sp. HTCC2170]
MKSIARKFQILVIATCLLGITAASANTTNEKNKVNFSIPADEVTGAWEYTVENVPYEYSKGVLMISKENKEYIVKVQLQHGAINAENVKVKDNVITFTVNVEGSNVSVTLNVDGDKMSGESSSYDGNFAIEGKRMQPE